MGAMRGSITDVNRVLVNVVNCSLFGSVMVQSWFSGFLAKFLSKPRRPCRTCLLSSVANPLTRTCSRRGNGVNVLACAVVLRAVDGNEFGVGVVAVRFQDNRAAKCVIQVVAKGANLQAAARARTA